MYDLFQPAEAKEIRLRDYQAQAVEALREGIRQKLRRQILCATTGAGKTLTSAHMLHEAAAKGSYTLFIVDRLALIDQTSAVFDEYGIPHGVVQGDHPRWQPHENVQVCSAQTLARRRLPRSPALIIVDEAHCFVAGTEIATPNGPVNIEELEEGDAVFNAFGIGRVRQMFYHETEQEIVRVYLEDGTQIECTADHRFFTGNAWVQARFLDGQSAVRIEDMPGLWSYLSPEDPQNGKGELACRARAELATTENLLKQLLEEVEEPDAQFGNAPENGKEPQESWAPSEGDGRQWTRPDLTSAKFARETWARLGRGDDCSNRDTQGGRASFSLQDRLGEPDHDGRNRGGRGEPLLTYGPGQRPEKGRVPFLTRVVSVQSVERRCPTPVYNLQVSGHPSYFANGVLVHNCQYKATLDYIEANPQAVVIGLTATPFTKGMGQNWDGIVNVVPTRELIDAGHLIEPTIYVAKSPEDAALGLNSYGEFSDESATSAGIEIVGDVVQEWITKTYEHFGGPVKTIVFSPTVEHGRELCAAFAEAGYNFQQVSYMDRSDEERREKIEEFRRPDSIINGLVSCGVLTRGFDVPEVRIGISCKPYRKSLSGHMQEMGRVMRTHAESGKDKALWLDHSGNVERFALDVFEVWENGVGDLDKSTQRDAKPRERNAETREKVVCPECSGALRGNTCLACGWEKPARSGIVNVEGELQAFDMAAAAMQPRAGLRADCLKEPRRVWEAALRYTMASTRKGEEHARKWAYGVFRGVYPNNKLPSGWFHTPVNPALDPHADSLVEREIKRFRKNCRRAA